jgi:hypothetical protein
MFTFSTIKLIEEVVKDREEAELMEALAKFNQQHPESLVFAKFDPENNASHAELERLLVGPFAQVGAALANVGTVSLLPLVRRKRRKKKPTDKKKKK